MKRGKWMWQYTGMIVCAVIIVLGLIILNLENNTNFTNVKLAPANGCSPTTIPFSETLTATGIDVSSVTSTINNLQSQISADYNNVQCPSGCSKSQSGLTLTVSVTDSSSTNCVKPAAYSSSVLEMGSAPATSKSDTVAQAKALADGVAKAQDCLNNQPPVLLSSPSPPPPITCPIDFPNFVVRQNNYQLPKACSFISFPPPKSITCVVTCIKVADCCKTGTVNIVVTGSGNVQCSSSTTSSPSPTASKTPSTF